MDLTRANVESILIKRTGQLLAAIGLDGTTADGTNTDLNDPIGYAVRGCGGTVSNFVLVADADITTVAESDYDKLLDIAELRTMQNVLGNWDLVDTKIGERDEKWSQSANALEKAVARKQKYVEDMYDFGYAELSTAIINLNFAEHDDDNVDELGY